MLIAGWDREGVFPQEEVGEGGVTIKRLRARGGYGWGVRNFPGLLLFNAGLALLCWRLRPRVFHAVDLDTALAGLIAKKVCGARLFYDIADWYSASRPRREPVRRLALLGSLVDALENRVAACADYVCLPEEERATFLRVVPRRTVVFRNVPEDLGAIHAAGHPEREAYIAYAGTLAEDRGVIDLMAAAEVAGVKLVIAGFGPLTEVCRDWAKRSRWVSFVGRLPHNEALRIQAAARAVAVLYDPRREINRVAAPTKMYEALMLGRPVIVAGDTSPARLVGEEGIGLVVRWGSRQELARAMKYLVEDSEEAERMGRRARRVYEERYTYARECSRLREAYEELLREPGKGALR